ncbi:hypothetical protein KKC97_00800 [bacterium]|nr:hypothetical protein [bacterium]MBU1636188.1 hypothetical protein [bacterium]
MGEHIDHNQIISFLNKRQVKLHHACSWTEAFVYASTDSILCRAQLSNWGAPKFYSDDEDKKDGLLHQVFFNLSDQGNACNRMIGIPNVYGPILFKMNADCLSSYPFITINRKSVTEVRRNKIGFDPIQSASELPTLYSKDNPLFLADDASHAELIVDSPQVALNHIHSIIVDPVPIGKSELSSFVRDLFPETRIYDRKFKSEGSKELYIELCHHVIETGGNVIPNRATKQIRDYIKNSKRKQALKIWAERIYKSNYFVLNAQNITFGN